MTYESETKRGTRPLIDAVAALIPGPVLRLRFLRAVMPATEQYPPRALYRSSHRSAFLIPLLVVLLMFTAPASIPPLRRASGPARGSVGLTWPPPAAFNAVTAVLNDQPPEIWQVEKTSGFETYSNGLRIDNRFSVANRPRSYRVISATHPDDLRGEPRSLPVGIVFHTTESLQVPFEARQNSALERVGESLLAYVKLKKAYNFVIDRFGRVYRVVQETDAANHAGNSIWSDSEWLYLNLNESFLAVSFETQTLPAQQEAAVNPAQVHSAAILTDMLRQRFGIPAGNCVTHAQVSVNAANLRIGYHFDWASSFPFEQLGLPDNYKLPLPAVSLFGFEYDSGFRRQAGPRLYQEAELAGHLLRERASAARLQVPVYRTALQKRYRSQLAAVHGRAGRTEPEE